ncbi:hypothetical protein HDU91_007067 [Kappamyces sp. JEL0680]|nr:hypothetical protein HDU91_007067 [Kappamyces sp. JEL0680]
MQSANSSQTTSSLAVLIGAVIVQTCNCFVSLYWCKNKSPYMIMMTLAMFLYLASFVPLILMTTHSYDDTPSSNALQLGHDMFFSVASLVHLLVVQTRCRVLKSLHAYPDWMDVFGLFMTISLWVCLPLIQLMIFPFVYGTTGTRASILWSLYCLFVDNFIAVACIKLLCRPCYPRLETARQGRASESDCRTSQSLARPLTTPVMLESLQGLVKTREKAKLVFGLVFLSMASLASLVCGAFICIVTVVDKLRNRDQSVLMAAISKSRPATYSTVDESAVSIPILLGQTIQQPTLLEDVTGDNVLFIVFNDLALRIQDPTPLSRTLYFQGANIRSALLGSGRVCAEVEYTVHIRQQPSRGRMAGLGDVVSRRMLDPPLIVQIDTTDQHCRETLFSQSDFLICKANLLEYKNGDHVDTVVLSKTSGNRTARLLPCLIGSRVVKSIVYTDVDNMQRLFFVFNELSVRLQGKYRIELHVINMNT